jgi:hypothetical protein
MKQYSHLNDSPFFYILSIGRSGSTLLEFILDAHPNINIPIESRFIIHLYYKYHSTTNWTEADKRQFIQDLNKDHKFNAFWEVNHQQLEEDILATSSDITFFELCRIITAHYISLFPKEEIQAQGSKNPIYGFWSDKLFELYPQAKFIHLVRDPMGVVNSQIKVKANKSHTYFAYRWRMINSKIDQLKKKHPNQFITLKYEDLIENPETSTTEVCTFLGLPFKTEQLSFHTTIKAHRDQLHKSNDQEKTELFDSYLANLVNPIDPSKHDSWKSGLTDKQKQEVLYAVSNLAKSYGYSYEFKASSFRISHVISNAKVKYRYLRHRMYYRFSMSLKSK